MGIPRKDLPPNNVIVHYKFNFDPQEFESRLQAWKANALELFTQQYTINLNLDLI